MEDLGLISGISRWKNREWRPPNYIKSGNLAISEWLWVVQHLENFKLGKYTDIGIFTYINAKYGVEVEDFVQIGSFSSIYTESSIDGKTGKVVLKRNSRIGSHTVILPNVTVGENSIIGAFSLVNKDIPSNVIAYGIPVKIVRYLTDEEIDEIKKVIKEVENYE